MRVTLAAILIGYALQISNGHVNGSALSLLTVALAACSLGLAAPLFPAFEQNGRNIVFYTTSGGMAFQLWRCSELLQEST
jgi:hypothetical protein